MNDGRCSETHSEDFVVNEEVVSILLLASLTQQENIMASPP